MMYKINELAKLAGISPRTLRYYDQIKLLVAKRDNESNYRLYNSYDVDRLQQILLYKEMGLELSEIKLLLEKMSSRDRIKVLESHLGELTNRQLKLEKLIINVKQTIKHVRGEIIMKDIDKFKGLKERLIKENEGKYKDEVLKNWGEEAYDKSRKQFKQMNETEFNEFMKLASNIITNLQMIKIDSNNEVLARETALMHKEWITKAWGWYDKDIHLNVAQMYVFDERFKAHYDNHGDGLAKILRDIIHKYIE